MVNTRRIDVAILIGIIIVVAISQIYLLSVRKGYIEKTLNLSKTEASMIYRNDLRPQITVILFHGFAGNKETMESLAYTMASAGAVSITVDLYGHGLSSRWMRIGVEKAEVAQFEDIFLELRNKIETLGLPKHIVFVGHSMGGALAFFLSIKYGGDFIGLAPAIGVFEDSNVSLADRTGSSQKFLFILARYDTIINNTAVYLTYSVLKQRGLSVALAYVGTEHLTVIFSDQAHHLILDWLKNEYGLVGGRAFYGVAIVSLLLAAIGVLLLVLLVYFPLYSGKKSSSIEIHGSLERVALVYAFALGGIIFVVLVALGLLVLAMAISFLFSCSIIRIIHGRGWRELLEITRGRMPSTKGAIWGLAEFSLLFVVLFSTIDSFLYGMLIPIQKLHAVVVFSLFMSTLIVSLDSEIKGVVSKGLIKSLLQMVGLAYLWGILVAVVLYPPSLMFVLMVLTLNSSFILGLLFAYGILKERMSPNVAQTVIALVYGYVAAVTSPLILVVL